MCKEVSCNTNIIAVSSGSISSIGAQAFVSSQLGAQVADAEAIGELWREGCTLQVVQPQRWEPCLMRLVAALETQLGCLVGVNAYLTPPSTQGPPPPPPPASRTCSWPCALHMAGNSTTAHNVSSRGYCGGQQHAYSVSKLGAFRR